MKGSAGTCGKFSVLHFKKNSCHKQFLQVEEGYAGVWDGLSDIPDMNMTWMCRFVTNSLRKEMNVSSVSEMCKYFKDMWNLYTAE